MTEELNALDGANEDAYVEEGMQPEQQELELDSQSEDIQVQEDAKDNVDYESYAKVQGWAPKERWRGNPDDWISAEEFVNRGKEFQSTLKQKNQSLEKRLQEQEDALARFTTFSTKMAEKGKQDAIDQIRREQKEALEDDDDKRYNELEERKEKVREDFKVEAPVATQQEPLEVTQFKRDNPWFDSDPMMRDYAIKYCDLNAGLPIAQQLEGAKKYIVESFPQKFQNARRQAPTVVNRGSAPTGKQSKGAKWTDLSDSEQRLAEGQMNQFSWSREQFLKEYTEMENL